MSTSPGRELTAVPSGLLVGILLLAPVYANLAGQVYVSELALLMLLPIAVLRRNTADLPQGLLAAGVIMVVAVVVASAAAGSSVAATGRGSLNLLLFVADLVVIHALLRGVSLVNFRRFIYALAAGSALTLIVLPAPGALEEPWKYGGGLAFTVVVVIWAGRFSRRFAASALVAMACVHLLLNARSTAVICLIAGAAVAFSAVGRLSFAQTLQLLCVAVLALTAAFFAYGYAASNGYLSPAAERKYASQGGGSPTTLLLLSRPELVFSGFAIRQDPLLGAGAEPPLTGEVAVPAFRVLSDAGFEFTPGAITSLRVRGQIPTHSYLLGTLVTGGLLTLPFWFILIQALSRGLRRHLASPTALAPAVTLLGVTQLWAIAFSPLGAGSRLFAAASIALCLRHPVDVASVPSRAASPEPPTLKGREASGGPSDIRPGTGGSPRAVQRALGSKQVPRPAPLTRRIEV